MTYILDLFTPETWQAFREAGASVTGFRQVHSSLAGERVKRGDVFLCYMTRMSRWCGVLRVQSDSFEDNTPIFDDPDPFPVRFRVEPVVLLDPLSAIPIDEDDVWNKLSITKQYTRGSKNWTGFFRSSLNVFNVPDGEHLENLLKQQLVNPKSYPFSEKDKRQLVRKGKVRTIDRDVEVEVPDSVEEEVDPQDTVVDLSATRESIQMQAKLAHIGVIMGFHVWVPRSDRVRVLQHIPQELHEKFLDALPLNYDDMTLRTVEQIDVIWLKGRSMARAFEVEHTTAIYSGLLRMADLLALQPNMNIRLDIVAPDDKRDKVLREIRRPVFSLLNRGPLYDQCAFLSYDSVNLLIKAEHLSYMKDDIIAVYEEVAEV